MAITASVKPLVRSAAMLTPGACRERGVADGVGLDLVDLRLAVAERAQRLGHGAVDDLEIAAAGELLELHQREVGLDARGVAIHHEADRAGRGDDGDLRVAVAMPLAERERIAQDARAARSKAGPGGARPWRGGMVERRRRDAELLVAVGETLRGAFASGGS